MEQNNQNTNNCGICNCCKWCPRWWCAAGKIKKIISVIIAIFVIIFIGNAIFGDENYYYNRLGSEKNTITVSGKGEIMVKPDIATVSFGVTTENLDVSKAQTESATKMNNIIGLLKNKGVEEKDIKTTYNIYPRYDYLRTAQDYLYSGRQVLAAYVVSQNIEVKIRDLSKIGEIISGVGEFGVTDVGGLTFSVDEEEKVKDQARSLAIDDAKKQAEILADELDVRLVDIVAFSENENRYGVYSLEKSSVVGLGGADSVTPQILTGENKITSNVSITYEIK